MIPLRDINPTRRFAFVTYTLIGLNIVAFLLTWLGGLDVRAVVMVPNRVAQGHDYLTVITAMFLHANLVHLGGNMLFLWIFGNNVEDRLGHLAFIFFYLLAGIGGSALQIVVDPTSTIPNVGASGAIAGVLGAYILWFPGARVLTLLFLGIFVTLLRLRAWIIIGYWIALQALLGLANLGGQEGGGVAYFAHIGGFLTGFVLGLVFLGRGRGAPAVSPSAR